MSTSFVVNLKSSMRPRLRRDLAERLGRDVNDPLVREVVAAGSVLAWLERRTDRGLVSVEDTAAASAPAVAPVPAVRPARVRRGRVAWAPGLTLLRVGAVLTLTRGQSRP